MRYLIGSSSSETANITTLAEVLKQDPTIKVEKVLGPKNKPDIIVVEMTAEKAEELKSRYLGKLIIEQDQKLNL